MSVKNLIYNKIVQKSTHTCNSLQRIAFDYVSSSDEDIGGVHITDSESEETNHNAIDRRRSKRVHNSTSNKRKQNSTKRMSGHQYLGFSTTYGISKQNSPKAARKLGPTCSSANCLKSKLRHCQKFDDDKRNNIFNTFWCMNWEAKRVFIKAYVSQIPKKRSTVEKSRKNHSFIFNLPYNQESLRVCQSMFLSTLSLNIGMVKGWLKVKNNPMPSSLVLINVLQNK